MKFPFYKFTLNLIADLCIAFGIQTSHAFAQTERDAEQASAPIVNSAMDGELFFKILLGELSLLDDKPRDAYALILDSAKKSKDEQLFERAMGIALQARAGESALTVAKAWRVALPDSLDAVRAEFELTIALNKVDLQAKALDDYLALVKSQLSKDVVARDEALISVLTLLARSSNTANKATVAPLTEKVLSKLVLTPSSSKPEMRVLYARTLQMMGRFDEGMKALTVLPEATPEQSQFKVNAQVQMLRDNQQFQAAYDLLNQNVQKLSTTDAKSTVLSDWYYDLAKLAEKTNRLGEMERLLRLVIAAKPDDAQAYNALGYSLADRGLRLAEAKVLLLKAVQLAPNDPFIADSLGWVEFKLGNLEQAKLILISAFEAKPDAEIATHLGEVLWTQGLKTEAITVWQAARMINPNHPTLLETLKRLGVSLDASTKV
ncbi:MAG: tetratricopeptide repeat protein [Polaromonas sp.]|nr:tetratricopeptide repeat protein [Polaromonas sp.]